MEHDFLYSFYDLYIRRYQCHPFTKNHTTSQPFTFKTQVQWPTIIIWSGEYDSSFIFNWFYVLYGHTENTPVGYIQKFSPFLIFDTLYNHDHTLLDKTDTTKPIKLDTENMNITFFLFENEKPKTFSPKIDYFLTIPLKILIFDSLYIHDHTCYNSSETRFPIKSSMENFIMIFSEFLDFKQKTFSHKNDHFLTIFSHTLSI